MNKTIEELVEENVYLKKQLRNWLESNGPGGWIDELRRDRDRLILDMKRIATTYEHCKSRGNHCTLSVITKIENIANQAIAETERNH